MQKKFQLEGEKFQFASVNVSPRLKVNGNHFALHTVAGSPTSALPKLHYYKNATLKDFPKLSTRAVVLGVKKNLSITKEDNVSTDSL